MIRKIFLNGLRWREPGSAGPRPHARTMALS